MESLYFVDDKGRKRKRKMTRAALPEWGVVTTGGSRMWQPTVRALVMSSLTTVAFIHDFARSAHVLQRLHP